MVERKIYQYGYDPSKLDEFIYRPKQIKTKWGYFTKIVDDKDYGLFQFFIKKGSKFALKSQKQEKVVFLETGSVNDFNPGESMLVPTNRPIDLTAKKDSFLYIFSGPGSGIKTFKKLKTFDRRQKDWAENLIETIVNKAYCGKKIFFKKGNSSSLNFHCKKNEVYFIHSGKALLRFKAGQGEDRFFRLGSGQAVRIPPGLMHQAGALEDLTIIEVSTHDEDADSFIVESEFMEMPRIK